MSSRMVGAFQDMVRINSESGEEKAFLEYLSELFSRDLHAECAFDAFGNLIARVKAKNCHADQPILLSCHGDTVKPGRGIDPVLENGVIRSRGDTILGGDDKAGIAELYEAILTAERHPAIEIAITRQEEVGLVGARNLDFGVLKSKMGFVLDGDTPDSIVVGGPSHMVIDVEITGKAAHAGMEPQKGISAIRAASHAIATIKEGWVDAETTCNVGMIEGGRIRNGVPEKAFVKAECRSLNHEMCIAYSDVIRQAFEVAARAIGATADVRMDLNYRASRISEDAPVVALACRALEAVGLTPDVRLICGGTDASIYNENGIQSVVLGIGCRAEHSSDEHIYVADMEKTVQILQRLFDLFCD